MRPNIQTTKNLSCVCLDEIENKLPRTKHCRTPCADQLQILSERESFRIKMLDLSEKVPTKKYRLGNQPEEYVLVLEYVDFVPEGFTSWYDFSDPFKKINGKEVRVVNPKTNESVVLVIDHPLILDAFPMSFFLEEESKKWHVYCTVTLKDKPEEKFIIPWY